MKKLVSFFTVFVSIVAMAQDTNQNYTKKTIYRAAGGGNPKHIVTYYDGLGRPIQIVEGQQSGSGKDIVTHIEYDALGRQVKEYLPYPSTATNLGYQSGAQQATLNYSQYSGQFPFGEKQLEQSPVGRVLKQGAPGADWQLSATGSDHVVKMQYQTNNPNEVRDYEALTLWNSSQELYDIQLTDNGFYAANELYKTVTKDENWTSGTNHTTEEFKDKEGRVVLVRNYNDVAHDTYYVYDIYGNLTYVIPPLVTNPASQLDELCYQYKYDHRNRLVAKKIPGKQWEYMVYDSGDRLVGVAPSLNPFGGTDTGWLITKYDGKGRPAYTGWYTGEATTAAGRTAFAQQYNTALATENWQGQSEIEGIQNIYSNKAYPQNSYKLLAINYYDTYAFGGAPTSLPTTVEGQTVKNSVKGYSTGSWVRILEAGTGTPKGVTSYVLYDNKYRPIRSYAANHLGGYTQTDNSLDFIGKVQYTKTYHKYNANSSLLSIVDTYSYTDQDRLLLHKQQINGGAEQLIAKNTYDELGKLISKNVGGTDVTGAVGLQKVDYRYNIRGWLTDINNTAPLGQYDLTLEPNDLFGFKINYNEVTRSQNQNIIKATNSMGGAVMPLYNGNISETFWRTKSDNVLRKYGYQYDAGDRIRKAFYQKPESENPEPGSYNESVTYDKNGNITSLNRTGNLDHSTVNITIDDLLYQYNGNQLVRVNDQSNNPEGFKDNGYGSTIPDYCYDANGNLTKDENKKIANILYNHANLPTEVLFTDGKKINYLYDANGAKIQKKVTTSTSLKVTDYINGFHYENQDLRFFPHDEGYVNVIGGTFFNYIFNYTDHLGNIRASWAWDDKNGALKILEENHYYPFGLKHTSYNVQTYVFSLPNDGTPGYNIPTVFQAGERDNPAFYKYRYNGKEFQDDLGINVYDFGARHQDPAIGRWMNIDPLAEQGRRWSPYSYSFDNPVYFVDPDGMWPYPAWMGKVQRFVNGFTNTISGMGKAVANDLRLGPTGKLLDVANRVGVSAYTGGVKGGARAMLNESGLPGIANTVTNVAKGDMEAIGSLTAVVAVSAATAKLAVKTGSPKVITTATVESGEVYTLKAPVTNEIYKRPNNATTVKQREYVQGKACVDCGETTIPMVADHKLPLVKEHYETGGIDLNHMRSLDAVQPQCTTCSSQQGAQMSKYSKEMKAIIKDRTSK